MPQAIQAKHPFQPEITKALQSIRTILDSTSPEADDVEKIVRIGWAIGALPGELRDQVLYEVQNRVMIGKISGVAPTDRL